MSIPFNRPTLTGNELNYITDAIERGQLSGDGYYTKQCERLLRDSVGSTSAHLTHSCTAALEMSAILADLSSGDEVILPSYTFVSTANAILLRGATPVFADIDPQTLNLCPQQLQAALSPRTKAICPVHYAGVLCDMPLINDIAKQHKLLVIEDAAQALGSSLDNIPAGQWGDLAAFSFHETKNIISGEGGCLVTQSEQLAERAEIIREKGTNRKAFFKGMVDKYSWVDIGSSFLPGELTSAFLYAQLENLQQINAQRLKHWTSYQQAFSDLGAQERLRTPHIPDNCQHNGHMYYLILQSETQRSAFIQHMKAHDITVPFHYVPLHSTHFARQNSRHVGNMAITNDLSQRLVRLPMYASISREIERVIQVATDFFSSDTKKSIALASAAK